jgi:hypothetical protein
MEHQRQERAQAPAPATPGPVRPEQPGGPVTQQATPSNGPGRFQRQLQEFSPRAAAQLERDEDAGRSAAEQIHDAFHGGLGEDEERALRVLLDHRSQAGAVRDSYARLADRPLEQEFRQRAPKQAARALGVLWPHLALADRLELHLLGWNDNEEGILQALRFATAGELANLSKDRAATGRYLEQLDADQRFEARGLLWPRGTVDHVGLLIQESDRWLWDGESSTADAILRLTPGQRAKVWVEHEGALAAMLGSEDLARVKRMCVDEKGEPVSEAAALTARMELATDGPGTQGPGDQAVLDTAVRAGELAREQALLEAALAAGADQEGRPLQQDDRRRIDARLLELDPGGEDEGVGDLLGGGFLDRARGDVDPDELATVQELAGGDPFDIAKQRILAAAGYDERGQRSGWHVNDDEAAIYRVLADVRGRVELEQGETLETVPPSELRERQERATAELLGRLRADGKVGEVLDGLDEPERERTTALTSDDGYVRALAGLDVLLDGMTWDRATILERLAGWAPEHRERFAQEQPSGYDDLVGARVRGERWRAAVDRTLETGQVAAAEALDYALGDQDDGTDEDLALGALTALSEADRRELRRGYALDLREGRGEEPIPVGAPVSDVTALARFKALRGDLERDLGKKDLDEALSRLVGVPTVTEVQSESGREDAVALMLGRQHERMNMRGSTLGNTDETLDQAHAMFLAEHHAVLARGQGVDVADLTRLAALDAEFDACFGAHGQASELAGGIAGTIAAVVVAVVVVAATDGAALPLLGPLLGAESMSGAALAAGLAAGGAAFAGAQEAVAGDFADADDAGRGALTGAVEVATAVAAAAVAARIVRAVGLSSDALVGALARAAADGSEVGLGQVGRSAAAAGVEAAIDGAIGGAVGDAVMTLTDARTWQQDIWRVLTSVGAALLRGAAVGAAAGGVLGGGLAGARRLLGESKLAGASVELLPGGGDSIRLDYRLGDRGELLEPRLLMGPEATDVDIAGHVRSLEHARSMAQARGRVAGLLTEEPPPTGTVAFEARLELEKLQELLDRRLDDLRKGRVDPAMRGQTEGEIAVFGSWLGVLDSRLKDLSEGTGRVGKKEAPEGYPDPPGGYYYYPNRQLDSGWEVRRKKVRDDLDPQEVYQRSDGAWDFRPREVRHSPLLDADLTADQAFDALMLRDSFARYVAMLESHQLASKADVVRELGRVGGLPEDVVLRDTKRAFRKRALDLMFESGGGRRSARGSSDFKDELLRDLHPADRGTLTERWYERYLKEYEGVAEVHSQAAMPVPGRSKPRKPDLVVGAEVVEVKSTGQGLKTRDVEQLLDFMGAARREDGHVLIGGKKQPVESVRLVFSDAAGAKGSYEELKVLLRDSEDVLTIEVFIDGKPRRFESLDRLKGALGD